MPEQPAAAGAVFVIQWFGAAPLTPMVGGATVTNSEMEIQGIERGKQYRFRVRAVRPGKVGPWFDQATRVANIQANMREKQHVKRGVLA